MRPSGHQLAAALDAEALAKHALQLAARNASLVREMEGLAEELGRNSAAARSEARRALHTADMLRQSAVANGSFRSESYSPEHSEVYLSTSGLEVSSTALECLSTVDFACGKVERELSRAQLRLQWLLQDATDVYGSATVGPGTLETASGFSAAAAGGLGLSEAAAYQSPRHGNRETFVDGYCPPFLQHSGMDAPNRRESSTPSSSWYQTPHYQQELSRAHGEVQQTVPFFSQQVETNASPAAQPVLPGVESNGNTSSRARSADDRRQFANIPHERREKTNLNPASSRNSKDVGSKTDRSVLHAATFAGQSSSKVLSASNGKAVSDDGKSVVQPAPHAPGTDTCRNLPLRALPNAHSGLRRLRSDVAIKRSASDLFGRSDDESNSPSGASSVLGRGRSAAMAGSTTAIDDSLSASLPHDGSINDDQGKSVHSVFDKSEQAAVRVFSNPTFIRALCSFVPRAVWLRARINDAPFIRIETQEVALLLADLSGFTAMSERLAMQGAQGIETLSSTLNAYLGLLCDVVATHGGDVVKFAGDALLCTFSSNEATYRVDDDTEAERDGPGHRPDNRIATHAILAAQASLRMHAAVGQFNEHLKRVSKERGLNLSQLSIHNALGYGTIWSYRVRATPDRWEFLVNGTPMEQVSQVHAHAKSDQTVVSGQLWAKIRSHFEGFPISEGAVRLDAQTESVPLPPEIEVDLALVDGEAIARYVPEAAVAAAETNSLPFLAELRQVSVVFTMLHFQTASTDDSRRTKLAHSALELISSVTSTTYKGMLRQFIFDDKGCVVITAFGVPPRSSPDDAYRALAAAIAGVREIDMQFGSELQAAAGVATGTVYCGAVGSDLRREYAMVGDHINLAARLSSRAKFGQVLCDGPTRREVSGRIKLDTMSPVHLKGKAEAVRIWSHSLTTVDATETGSSSSTSDHNDTFLDLATGSHSEDSAIQLTDQSSPSDTNVRVVGRDRQLRRMNKLLEQALGKYDEVAKEADVSAEQPLNAATSTHPSTVWVVTITGETGLGKSTLVSTWQEGVWQAMRGRSGDHPLPTDISGRILMYASSCDEVTSSRPYFAFSSILRQLLGVSGTAAQQRDLVLHTVTELDPNLVPLVPLLEAVLLLGFKDSIVTDLFNAQQRVDKIVEIVLRLLARKALKAHKILVIVIDNTHWIDPSSKNLLNNFISKFPLPAMVVIARQPSLDATVADAFDTDILAVAQRLNITLSPLEPGVAKELICRTVGLSDVPQPFLDYILSHSRGVPLLVKQLTLALRDNEVFEVVVSNKTGAKEMRIKSDLAAASLPQSVKSIVIARFDHLTPRAQLALKTAVVIASGAVSFTVAEMAALEEVEDVRNARYCLHKLLQLDLVERTIQSARVQKYSESSDSENEVDNEGVALYTVPLLIQSVVYDLMLRSQRELLHERCARMYERIGGESDEYILQLAHHWRNTRDKVRGSDYTWKAVSALSKLADKQIREFSNEEAWKNIDIALELLRDTNTSFERSKAELKMLLQAVPVIVSATDWGHAANYIDDAAALFRELQDDGGSSEVFFEGLERPFVKMMFHLAMQKGLIEGNMHALKKYVREAAKFVSRLQHPPLDLEVQVAHMNWTLLFQEGNFSGAIDAIDAGIQLYDQDIETHNQPTNYFAGHDAKMCALWHRVLCYYALGDFARVRSGAVSVNDLVEQCRHANTCGIGEAIAVLGTALVGDYSISTIEQIASAAERCESRSVRDSLPFSRAISRVILGWTMFHRGDRDGGLLQASSVMKQAQFLPFRSPVICLIGEMFLAASRFEEAEAFVDATISRWKTAGFTVYLGEMLRIRAEARLSRTSDVTENASEGETALREQGKEDLHDALRSAAESRSPTFALTALAAARRHGIELVESEEQAALDLLEEIDPSEPLVQRLMPQVKHFAQI